MAQQMAGRLACIVIALACAATVVRAADPAPRRLRVLTYNIHHGEGTDRKLDLARIARVISDQKPDLVALQEVDKKTRRTGNVDQPAELARLTGLNAAFGRGIDFEGGEYGNAVLSRFPIDSTAVHALPVKEGEERRCALVATVRPWGPGPQVAFVATHLNHRDEAERVREVEEIHRVLADERRPTVLAGDLNARPATPPLQRFAGAWLDAAAAANVESSFTFPSDKPVRRIDYVLLRPAGGWRVVETAVVNEPVASDHRPVLAVVEWQGGQAEGQQKQEP
jgi:endonuclease/exonuclease/phosphatase family metal-dependent hydrolase